MTNDSPLAQGNRYCGAAPGDPYLRCCARPARGAPGARRHRCLLRRVVYWAGEASTAVTRPGGAGPRPVRPIAAQPDLEDNSPAPAGPLERRDLYTTPGRGALAQMSPRARRGARACAWPQEGFRMKGMGREVMGRGERIEKGEGVGASGEAPAPLPLAGSGSTPAGALAAALRLERAVPIPYRSQQKASSRVAHQITRFALMELSESSPTRLGNLDCTSPSRKTRTRPEQLLVASETRH